MSKAGAPRRLVTVRDPGRALDGECRARLVVLLATGLERWLTKQSGPGEVVDFTANQSVTNGHDDNVNEELPWH